MQVFYKIFLVNIEKVFVCNGFKDKIFEEKDIKLINPPKARAKDGFN